MDIAVNALTVLVAVTAPRNQARIADARAEAAHNDLIIAAVRAVLAALNNFNVVASFAANLRQRQIPEIAVPDIDAALPIRLNAYRSANVNRHFLGQEVRHLVVVKLIFDANELIEIALKAMDHYGLARVGCQYPWMARSRWPR